MFEIITRNFTVIPQDLNYFEIKEKLNENSWRLIGAAAEIQDKCACYHAFSEKGGGQL